MYSYRKIWQILLLIGLVSFASRTYAQDTITVELGEKAKIIIYTEDREGLLGLRELDLNQIIKDVTQSLDTTQYEISRASSDSTEIKVYEYVLDTEKEEMQLVEMDSSRISSASGSDHEQTLPRMVVFWGLELGLDGYHRVGQAAKEEAPELRPGGSRYLGFGVYQRFRLGKNRGPFSIQTGLEFNWLTYRFEGDAYIAPQENGIRFGNFSDDFEMGLTKSKLSTTYLNVPLTFNLRLRNPDGRRSFMLGAGGYVGYRLGGRTKIRSNDDQRFRQRDNLFLNDWRYGVEFQAGYRNFLLFFKQDLSYLFEEDQGPQLQPFVFGVRF